MEIIGMRHLPGEALRMLGAVFLGLVLALVFAATAFAAPRAHSPQECAAFADYALTSRALYAAEVEEQKRVLVLKAMYQMPDDRTSDLALAVRVAAGASSLPARDFAEKLLQACVEGSGNMDSMLGGQGT